MRPWILAAVVGVLLALWATPAEAHALLLPGELAPGTSGTAQLMIVHGCGPGGTMPTGDDDAFATEAITLEVPEALAVSPLDAPGWTVETTGDDGRTRIRWEADAPVGGMETVRFDVELEVGDLREGSELWLPVIQDCEGGESMAWTHPDTAEADMTTLPAARLIVAHPTDPAGEGGLPTSVVVTLALAVAVVAGGVAVAVSGRRG